MQKGSSLLFELFSSWISILKWVLVPEHFMLHYACHCLSCCSVQIPSINVLTKSNKNCLKFYIPTVWQVETCTTLLSKLEESQQVLKSRSTAWMGGTLHNLSYFLMNQGVREALGWTEPDSFPWGDELSNIRERRIVLFRCKSETDVLPSSSLRIYTRDGWMV